jgi:hypothetical protein
MRYALLFALGLPAQHHSQSCFADTAYQQLTAHGFRFQDTWQLLRIHPDELAADVVCGVNGGAVLGWEVTGLNDVAIAVKGLRVEAVVKSAAKP